MRQLLCSQHKKDAQATVLSIKDVFTYTDQSRPLKHFQKIGNAPEQLLSLNEYNALGRLKSKKVGGTDISGGAPLQIVDYKYNIRGWLTDINDYRNLARSGGPQNLFAFRINYDEVTDDINGAVQRLYNGNISETFWRTNSDNVQRKYGYSYDYQNRLLAAFYQKPTTAIPRADSYSTEYSYDRNGNILSLKRNGQNDIASQTIAIDELDYSYDAGNRLQKVLDNTDHPAGFNMNNAGTNEKFMYDKYGNLISDPYKKISNISYNHLNLPTKITFSSGGKIEYFYNATGNKLKKKVTDGTTITTTDYMDGFQYTNNVLDFFPHSEGYVKALAAGLGGGTSYDFKYVFTYTDHLGNIRLKYAQDPSKNNAISILEEDHYYPYGLKHSGYNTFHQIFTNDDGKGPGTGIVLTPVNPFLGDSYKYKFGGKEYQDEFDINTYDFGARNYDPALGRWMNIDPLAEMMRRHSPYNYAFNNPVFFIDPDGMSPLPVAVTSLGMGVDGVKDIGAGGSGGFDVRTYDKNGNTLDSTTVNDKQGVDISADGTITANDRQTPEDIGGVDLSLSGGCPDGNCDDGLHRYMNIAISLEKWVEKYGNWSQEDLALETGEETFGPLALPKGMPLEWRYVVNPYDGNVMDMRHVVVVGYGMGEVKGLVAELIQKFFGLFGKDPTNSAFDLQDRYSNNIGAAFHTYDFRKNGFNMSFNFGNNFNEFLRTVYKK